jgi:hypothetical protein
VFFVVASVVILIGIVIAMLGLSSSMVRSALSGLLLCSSFVGVKCAGESSDKHWVDIWATMPQLVEPANLPPAPYVSSPPILSFALVVVVRCRRV